MRAVATATGFIVSVASAGCLAPDSVSTLSGVAGSPPSSSATGSPPAVADAELQSGLLNAVAKLTATLQSYVEARVSLVAEVNAALARVEDVEANVAGIQTRVRDVTIGGEGDSVTSWIQAAGPWAAWILYPLVWRPIRRWRNGPRPAGG